MKRKNYLLQASIALAWVLAFGNISCSNDDDSNEGKDIETVQNEVVLEDEEDQSFTDLLEEEYGDIVAGWSVVPTEESDDWMDRMSQQALEDGKQLVAEDAGSNGEGDINDLSIAKITLKYYSVDGKGNRIQLSGFVFLPKVNGKFVDCKDILLNCHQTSLDTDMLSTGSLKARAADGLAVIEPHYIGFGATAGMKQTYLCHKLIGQQCADMIPALMTVLEKKGVKMQKGYGTYVVGYSQGGGNALAVGRYLEMDASSELRKLANLKKVVCGAGPYDPYATFQHWLKTDSMCMSVVLPMVVQGMMEGHSDVMAGIKLGSYFSDLYKSTGIIEKFEKNELDGTLLATDMMPQLAEINLGNSGMLSWMRFSGIMSEEFADVNSHIRQALEQCLKAEVITDWVLSVPVVIYSSTTDNVIPVQANAINLYNKMKEAGAKNVTLRLDDSGFDHMLGFLNFTYLINCEKIYLESK